MIQNDQQTVKGTIRTKETHTEEAVRHIIMHHLTSFQDNDLDAVVSDYRSDSVLITQERNYTGPEEIRTFFAALMLHFPKHKSNFELDKIVVNHQLVYIVWHAKTPSLFVSLGTDTFVLKDGKIQQQTFAGDMKLIDNKG
jgi:hypothetical protein